MKSLFLHTTKILVALLALVIFVTPVFSREQNFSPATGDVLSQAGFERAVTTEEGGVILLYADGSKVNGFPVFADAQVVASSPLLADVIGDSFEELIFVTRKGDGTYYLFVYDGSAKLIGSISLGSDLIYYDPISVLIDGKSDIIVANTKGLLTQIHLSAGGLSKSVIKDFGIPVGITSKIDGKEIVLTYPEKNTIEVYSFDGKNIKLGKSVLTDSPIIFPVIYGEQVNVVYGVNKKQEMTAINISDGQQIKGFPSKLNSEPVGSPTLSEIDSSQSGKEIVVSLSDGTKKAINVSGGSVSMTSTQESYTNPAVAIEELGGGFFSGIRHFALNIISSAQRTLISFFGRVRAFVYITNPDIQISFEGEQILSGGKLSFPMTDVGKVYTKIVTISNKGDGNLNLTGSPLVSVTGSSDFSISYKPSAIIIPGQTTAFEITFKPTIGSNVTATILIENSDKKKNPFKINLLGSGNTIDLFLDATPVTGSAPLGVVFLATASGGGNISAPQAINFSNYAILSSGNLQDSSNKYILAQNGKEIDLSGSTSKYIDYLKNISSDTILNFFFKSTQEGEMHGVGITTDDGYAFFQIAGSVINVDNVLEFYDYGGNEWKSYSIPIGNYITGKINKITFVSGAKNGDLSVNSMFKDVKVYGANDASYIYTWDFENDGKTDLSGAGLFEAYHLYSDSGTYTASLVVTDGKITVNKQTTIIVK